ncbi:ATP-dependent helicase [Clostridium sp. HMP27]|uniref:UvrD-helicase domain-containing protein n=1 Tax=Clostridium sp. HMP27 TaxID=1487921 RepID=UPI00068CDCA1|nr:ATP-dependent helicase [Clostridium sp. HMP27]
MNIINIEDLFIKTGFKPNRAQEEAIKNIEGPLYIVAGPGSGKTRVLLWRCVNLIVFHEINPEEIFLSTFTEKAAKQLKAGLISLLALATAETGKHYDISDMYVGTVHSLCQRFILDKRFKNALKKKLPTIMQEIDQYFYISSNKFLGEAITTLGLPETYKEDIREYMNLKSTSKNEIVNCLMSVFNRFSEECIDADEIISNKKSDKTLSMLGKLYKFYLESLYIQPRKTTDLSLLQQYGYEVLCVSRNSGSIFKHIIIDEYQDTNNIQEKIFFKLSKNFKNICVVGDDDQSLYRFRGATVENFVQFHTRCKTYIGVEPKKIKLNINYRSRKKIVEYYTSFIEKENWENEFIKGRYYRNVNKNIKANSSDDGAAVVTTVGDMPLGVYKEIVKKVKEMIDKKIVSDPSDVAVLFTYLKGNENAAKFKAVFEQAGIKVYAPRAGRFLDNPEPIHMFGLMTYLFGVPEVDEEFNKGKQKEFNDWIQKCYFSAEDMIGEDYKLRNFIDETIIELDDLKRDYVEICKHMSKLNISFDELVGKKSFAEFKYGITGKLSEAGKREINKKFLEKIIDKKLNEGSKLTYRWLVNRINSLDWNLMDLFYRLCGFQRFKKIFDNAEEGIDEGPIYNLSNITKYIQFFTQNNNFGLITGQALQEEAFIKVFIMSYLGALYKREEGDYEIKDEPIPKGRVSFLTIHQSKGLEFPVVILGAVPPVKNTKNRLETIVRPYLHGEYEPLDKISSFDKMRSYYVALSRAENLLVIPNFRGRGQNMHPYFKEDILSMELPLIESLNVNSIPKAKKKKDEVVKVYSYTSDYLAYNECPRKYMIYKKYNFVPARNTTTFFGNLLNKTLEDIHKHYIELSHNGEETKETSEVTVKEIDNEFSLVNSG